MIKDCRYETHLSTQQDQTRPDPRVPKKNVHQTGKTHYQSQKSQGSQAVGTINSDVRLTRTDKPGTSGNRNGKHGDSAPDSNDVGPVAFFQKSDRILKRSQFQQLSTGGCRVHSCCFLAVFQQKGLPFSRLGVTVSKKVGGAVTRNRIKRLVREFFRRNRETLRGCYDLNIIAKKKASELTSGEIFFALEHLFKNIASKGGG
jgi:ribonuclease P protein component